MRQRSICLPDFPTRSQADPNSRGTGEMSRDLVMFAGLELREQVFDVLLNLGEFHNERLSLLESRRRVP